MIKFKPRNVGCWRYTDGASDYANIMLFEEIEFPSETALEIFLTKWFKYKDENKPIMHIKDDVVTFGLVVGFIK